MRDHRSLEAWEEAHPVAPGVLNLSKHHWRPWASAVVSQIQRSSPPVQLNIAEGWTFGKSPTSTRHLTIACGSVVETIDLIDLMIEADIVPATEITGLKTHASQAQQLLLGLLKQRRPM